MNINILGRLIPIKYDQLTDSNGEYDSDKKEITINKKVYDLDELRYIELHEIIHALVDRIGFDQMPSFTGDLEEVFCHAVATIMVENYEIYPKKNK